MEAQASTSSFREPSSAPQRHLAPSPLFERELSVLAGHVIDSALILILRPALLAPLPPAAPELLLRMTLWESGQTPPVRVRVGRTANIRAELRRAFAVLTRPYDVLLYNGPHEHIPDIVEYAHITESTHRLSWHAETLCIFRKELRL